MLSNRNAGIGPVRLVITVVAALVLALALATVGDSPAHAAGTTKVVGTFKYKDTDPNTGAQTDRPIAGAKVEIWRFRNRIWPGIWAWGKDAETRTDANGNISVDVPFSENGVIYGLRVFASNDAAVVWPNDLIHTTPFFREPGKDDNAEIQKKETAAGQTLDFSYTFHGWSSQHFNIAEVARHGKAFADANRDPSETDPLPPANFQPQDSPTTSYYNPVNDTVNIDNPHVDEDLVILHEYAHYVEDTISKFAPIPAVHDGCTATLPPLGTNINSVEHAWMEGFADYFAQAARLSAPTGSLTGTPGRGTPTVGQLESASCPGLPSSTIPGDAVENFVAGSLWDISDPFNQPGEPNDQIASADRQILQIFDRELDTTGTDPTITRFRDAWMARGLPDIELSRILIMNKVPLRTNYPPTANAGADQTTKEGTTVSLDGSRSSDPDLNPLSFSWTQVGGPSVTLSNASGSTPSFTAPQLPSGSAALVFRLVVNDGKASSAPDEVTVQVNDIPRPPNDDFANAQTISGSPVSVGGTNKDATREPGEPAHGPSPFTAGSSVWYSWTAPSSGTATVDTCTGNFNTFLAAYTGSPVNALTRVASNDGGCASGTGSKVTFEAQAGTTYRIAVASLLAGTGSQGTFTLKVGFAPPSNDAFASAQTISGGNVSVDGTTLAATRQTGEPDHYVTNPPDSDLWTGDHSVWYRWTAPFSGRVEINTCAAKIDGILAVYTGGTLGGLSRVADNNNGCPSGWGSKVTLVAQKGTAYTISVSDAGGLRQDTSTLRVIEKVPPSTIILSPAPGATGVAPAANVMVTFSEPMRASTINATNIRLRKAGTTTSVPATVTYDAANKRAILNPNANLAPGSTYIAAVTTGATDLVGNPLAASRTWKFTVK